MLEMAVKETMDVEIADFQATTNLLAATMNLFTADLTPNEDTVIGALTLPTYTGNGPETLTWHDPSRADTGEIEVVSDPVIFRPTDAVTPNTVFGCFLKSALAGTPLLAAVRFEDAPLPMGSALDEIMLVVRVRGGKVYVELIS